MTSVTDGTAPAFYGSRYVMSDLDQRTLGLDTRASMTFTPTMTLEVYVQPFFAAGRYPNFEEFAAPRSTSWSSTAAIAERSRRCTDANWRVRASYAIDPDGAGPASSFSVDNPDFSQQSLRGNAVFRWEYRPGSVLVRRMDAVARGIAGVRRLSTSTRDRTALLASRPDNVFLVKASWWLAR